MKILFLLLFLLSCMLATPAQEAQIRTILKTRFHAAYPTMIIERIDLKPATSLINKLADYQVSDVTITKDTLRRAKGNVMVTLQKGSKKRKLYFKYRIHADITLYTAATSLQRERTITPETAVQTTIPFTMLYHRPVDESAFYHYVARRHIKAGSILSYDQLKKRRDIARNDTVTALIKDGGLVLSFQAKALQEGDVGDVIKIRKDYKKRFKARILSNTTVEVIE